MKKCDFHCCCSEEMALPGKPTAFPSPVIFPWVQGDGRKVVLVPKRPVQCPGGEAFPRLSQGAAKLLPHIWGGKGGEEEQAPTTGCESHWWRAPGEEPEATWKGCAAHQPLGSVCPISAGLCTGEVASAEPASPYTVIAMDRQFKAVRRGDKLNVVQLPVKPHAGRNDL